MFRDRETGCVLYNASLVFSESLAERTFGFPNVQPWTSTARDAVNNVLRFAVEVLADGS